MTDYSALELLGITPEQAEEMVANHEAKGKRDSRVCVCGHPGGSHYPTSFVAGEENLPIERFEKGRVGCQAGKTPCECDEFQWVLTAKDVRSFIYKTLGPGPDHALARGVSATIKRGIPIEWRAGIVCFTCGKPSSEVGPILPIAYNERGVEASRSTNQNRMHCAGCRERIRAMVS